jgi:L-arabinose isomerase
MDSARKATEKTAALLRAMKVMGSGLRGSTSFMQDYTYDFGRPAKVLGAHTLEVCPWIAAETPTCEIHPLSIEGKSDPVRLVFTAPAGPAVNASILQIGNRFRMIVNEVDLEYFLLRSAGRTRQGRERREQSRF